MTTNTAPRATRVLAAPAPGVEDDDDAAPHPISQQDADRQRRQHEQCEAYAAWRARCQLWGPPPLAAGTLGRLTKTSSPWRAAAAGADAPCSSLMSAMHVAVISQPLEALDRRVFELHYVHRVRNIKAAAQVIGISRRHWYRLLDAFRNRACSAAAQIELHATNRVPMSNGTM